MAAERTDPRGYVACFKGGPCAGTKRFVLGEAREFLWCKGAAYEAVYDTNYVYEFIPEQQRDALRAWNRLMRSLAHDVPRSGRRSAAARRRAKRLLR